MKSKEWKDTLYLTSGKTQRGADCSGTTWNIYEEAGFSNAVRVNLEPIPNKVVLACEKYQCSMGVRAN